MTGTRNSVKARAMFDRQSLIDFIGSRALQFGQFTLASGQKSHYYLDGKQITLNATGLRLVSEGFFELLRDVDCEAIGGMSLGADPIVGGVLLVAAQHGCSWDGFLVRKEPKRHGTNRSIEGPLEAGARVVVLEDVITTGGSALQAVDRLDELECRVVCILGIVDRKQGAAEAFAARNIPFKTLLTVEDLGIDPSGLS